MTTVINLIGPSGSGKSTTALGLTYELKLRGYKVENITEWVKEKIFADELSVLTDQLYIFANQRRKQIILKDKELDFIVTDSPLLLSNFYGLKYNTIDPLMNKLFFNEFFKFQNINFLLKRTVPFETFGRMESEEQSDKDYLDIINFLKLNHIDYAQVNESEKTQQILQILNIGNKL